MDLYRYISFESFVDIVQSETLTFVSPLTAWEDTYEGLVYRALKTKEGREIIKNVFEKKNLQDTSDFIERIVYYLRCQCWSKENDSIAMWSIYSHNGRSLMIKTSYEKLKQIKDVADILEVKYIDTINLEEEMEHILDGEGNMNIGQMFKSKRTAFKHENEVRIFGVNRGGMDPKKPIKIDIRPITNFIEGVMVNPKAPNWYVETVKTLCLNNDINFLGKSELYNFQIDFNTK